MPEFGRANQTHVTVAEIDGRRYNVAVRVVYDGVEYVGRLLFADESWEDPGVADRGTLPGRTEEEVLALARRLRPDELLRRYRRALEERRRYSGLRTLTADILTSVRYLNQLAVSMRTGLLDTEAAAQEIDLTEQEILAKVTRLRDLAGVEEV